ncbi:MAG: Hsp33 family molecular chaperone HslO [Gammaproteobacteria bacterium]|nr:Hsp33 family molecular chaperone HslO [Gammaproteobacteria bacterium]
MPDNDLLHRFIIENTRVRGEMVHLNATWKAALARYNYPENVRNILGEAFAACALLSATIKYEGSLILQIRGDGPLHLLVVQATSEGTLRGLARWGDDVPAHNLKNIFGNAQMVITVEQPSGKPYQGIIALQGEHIQDAIENYFKQSEQLNTRLWLNANNEICTGFLLQELPETRETRLSNLGEDHNDWQHAQALGNTLTKEELLTLSSKEILHRLFHEDDVRLFDPSPLSFRCSCSNERISKMIISLGLAEARSIISEQGKVHVDCEFCNAQYDFDSIDVENLFASSTNSAPSQSQH